MAVSGDTLGLSRLQVLDVSWLRGVSDHALGALVDSCARLEQLTVWGCAQLTPFFFNGHSKRSLKLIGRSACGGLG